MADQPPERLRINEAVLKTGLAKRTIQKMAQRGEIPGAAKLGSVWTFSRHKLARWISDAERQCAVSAHSEQVWGRSENPYVQKIRERRRIR
jgi:predicted DNA-binding transcriptional regulator AlpA